MNNKHQKLPALTALTTIVNNYKPVQKENKTPSNRNYLQSFFENYTCEKLKQTHPKSPALTVQKKNIFLFICAKECSACELVRMDAQQAILHRYDTQKQKS